VIIAHVGGVPLEEILPALAGTSTSLVLVRAWLMLRRRPLSSAARRRSAP
jgi:hypothetical protein